MAVNRGAFDVSHSTSRVTFKIKVMWSGFAVRAERHLRKLHWGLPSAQGDPPTAKQLRMKTHVYVFPPIPGIAQRIGFRMAY